MHNNSPAIGKCSYGAPPEDLSGAPQVRGYGNTAPTMRTSSPLGPYKWVLGLLLGDRLVIKGVCVCRCRAMRRKQELPNDAHWQLKAPLGLFATWWAKLDWPKSGHRASIHTLVLGPQEMMVVSGAISPIQDWLPYGAPRVRNWPFVGRHWLKKCVLWVTTTNSRDLWALGGHLVTVGVCINPWGAMLRQLGSPSGAYWQPRASFASFAPWWAKLD